ncbi:MULTISPECIES: Crp/Fnr family transcriptional regulator [Neptunomonas]|uniref:Crp/Fnr family transcriptional regulator n=1 Tax=Neptunomonas marina TaxID=1815562 RepID=A0A437QDX5_9GAMM|nr:MULTISPECIES: Crp/Fnr family transcriptional regulator [Neptunomonas]RVU32645.1 Crp/Fnr family transcriptional regulator [Neptunomonas marina]
MTPLTAQALLELIPLDRLKEASTFGALSGSAIEYLLHKGSLLKLSKGEALYQYGDPGGCFYVVLDGALAFYKHHEGKMLYIRDFCFGEELGFMAMVALHHRVGSAEAAEDTIVLEVSCGLFHDLHDTMPADFGVLLLNLSREMARVVRELENRIVKLELPE